MGLHTCLVPVRCAVVGLQNTNVFLFDTCIQPWGSFVVLVKTSPGIAVLSLYASWEA